MGEARRRKLVQTHAELQAGFDAMQAEGQGVWRMEAIAAHQIPAILVAAAGGNPAARRYAEAIADMVRAITHWPDGQKPLCITCDTTFTPKSAHPGGLVMLHADRSDARHHSVSLVCTECFDRQDLKDRCLARLNRQGFDFREIHLHDAGRA